MSLGQDSVLELDSDFGEAVFFLQTFFNFIIDPEIFKRNRFWLLLISSLLSSIIIYLTLYFYCRKNKINFLKFEKIFKYSFNIFIFVAILFSLNIANKSYKAGKKLKLIEKNFSQNIKNFQFKRTNNKELDVIVYVGESTSALNLSLYGYPFETTPWLNSQKNNEKFIAFSNMYSNHTHTLPSLSNALSICINPNIKKCSLTHFQPLKKNKVHNYLSLVDAVKKANINTHLFSTQGNLGASNISTKQLLNTNNQKFSFEKKSDKFKGAQYSPKKKDRRFFLDTYCKDKKIFQKGNSNLVFLHSYAGHGQFSGYKNYIEDDIKFSYPGYINKKNFLGREHRFFELTYEYDLAMSYIDSSIKNIANCSFFNSNKNKKPLIFIYFADHGESPYSGRGHDSARITYEMLHVPFLIYFNDKAYELYKDKFDFIKNIKNENLTLRTFSEIILYIFDLDILSSNGKLVLSKDDFKTFEIDYVLEREDLNGKIKKIHTLWNDKVLDASKLIDNDYKSLDVSIKLWQLNNLLKKNGNNSNKKFCMHRANSFILQYKSALSINCFETDIFHFEEKTISAHDVEKDTNLIFENFLESNFEKTTIWMDSKNLNQVDSCNYGYKWLIKNSGKFKKILVEIPPNSIEKINNPNWINCIKKINLIKNVEIGYYLSKHSLKKCEEKINSEDCEYLTIKTKKFLDKTSIKSITFDYLDSYKVVNSTLGMDNYRWHLWGIDELKDVKKLLEKNNVGLILLRNDLNVENIM